MARLSFDEYSRKARLAPILLAALPSLSIAFHVPELGPFAVALPLIFTASLGFFAEQVVRSLGRATERRLTVEWGGLPTTRGLRASAIVAPAVLEQRRRDVERLSGMKLPTKREEKQDQAGADARYVAAVRRCLSSADRSSGSLMQLENMHYGFRRNLRALKPLGLAVAGVCFAINLAVSWSTASLLQPVHLAIAIGLAVIAAVWLFYVRDGWVREQADIFAERFFESLNR